MTYPYKVFTQHAQGEPGRFICPIDIEASSERAAAEKRFAKLVREARREVTALLVLDDTGYAFVYPVRHAPHVSLEPLQVGS